jgi:hypothetical protein
MIHCGEHLQRGIALWVAPSDEPVIERVAVAGDFLPAGSIHLRSGASWREMAAPLWPQLADVAVVFLNLEACLDVEGLSARKIAGIGTSVAAPAACIEYLEAIRARAIGVANNHAFDFGPEGVQNTRKALSCAGLTPLGGGDTLKKHPEIHVWQGNDGIRVGFWTAAKATHDPATAKCKGVEPATIHRSREALRQMDALGARCRVALLHAGCARSSRPDPEDLKLLHDIAEAGFDVVAASHSHRISGFTKILRVGNADAFCFHGLGSLVSGYATAPIEQEGLIVVLGFNALGKLARVEVRPVLLDDDGFGRVPDAESSRSILDRFLALSQELASGSYKRRFYEDTARGLLQFSARDVRTAFRNLGVRGLFDKARRIRGRHVRRLMHAVLR